MNPGGRLVAQCGGKGNIHAFRTLADEVALEQPFAPYFADWKGPWNYADAPETAERLEAAGFTEINTWLEPKSVAPADARAFVHTVCLVRHLDLLPEAVRGPFVARVLERAGNPLVLEYVRLNMTAVAR